MMRAQKNARASKDVNMGERRGKEGNKTENSRDKRNTRIQERDKRAERDRNGEIGKNGRSTMPHVKNMGRSSPDNATVWFFVTSLA